MTRIVKRIVDGKMVKVRAEEPQLEQPVSDLQAQLAQVQDLSNHFERNYRAEYAARCKLVEEVGALRATAQIAQERPIAPTVSGATCYVSWPAPKVTSPRSRASHSESPSYELAADHPSHGPDVGLPLSGDALMSWPFLILLGIAGASAFLLGLAVAALVYLMPRPRRFGFEVRNDD